MELPANQFPPTTYPTPKENSEHSPPPSETNTHPTPKENSEQSPPPSETNTETSQALSSRQFPTNRFLVNRITYFGFVISLFAVVVNFFLTKDNINTGITFDLMMWIMFGIFWCGGFAMMMGPFFSFVAGCIRLLDVIPALGSSLVVLLSVWLTVEVITDNGMEGFPGFLNNLPLFSLIIANGIPFVFNWKMDSVSRTANQVLHSDVAVWSINFLIHAFENGKHNLRISHGTASHKSLTSIPCLGVSEAFVNAHYNIREKSLIFLRGDNLDEFSTSFDSWRTEARRIRRVLLLRRLLCLLGYIIEAAALYFSFVFLNQLKRPVHTGKDDKKPESDPIQLLLPIWQIVLVVVLSFFSNYLQVFIDVESTCTSPAEVSSLTLRKMESWTTCSGLRTGFLDIGKRKSIVPWKRRFGELRAAELPTIGIVADDSTLETGIRTLRSTIGGFEFTVRRIASNTIRLQRVREDDEDREAMYSESIEIGENDNVI